MRNIFLVLVSVLLVGCQWDSSTESLPNDYVISWVDLPNYRNIHKEGRSMAIRPHVFEIGYNDEYIIAKQHPQAGDFQDANTDVTKVNFFVLKMEQNNLEEKIWGALTELEFISLLKDLGISDIEFTIKYKVDENIRID